MTLDEYQSAITRLGLSQVKAARLFGYNERTSRRWANGEQQVPRIVEIVLWLMLKFSVKPDDIPTDDDSGAPFREPKGKVMRDRTPY